MAYRRINKFGITRYFGGRKTFQRYGSSKRILVQNFKIKRRPSASSVMTKARTVSAQRQAGFNI